MTFVKTIYSRRYLLLLLFVCLLFFIKVWSTDKYEQYPKLSSYVLVTQKPRIIFWGKPTKNLSCHYSVQDDALPSVEDPNVSLGNNSIFFHETSCRGGINSRQACTVESAARLHPNRQVNFLFSSPITEHILKNSSLTKLREFRNVNMYRIHIEHYGNDTAVENILAKDLWKSAHPIEHAADILRIVTLYKYGGLYLDTDSFLVKNLDALPSNFIGKESNTDIATGIIAFAKDETGKNLTTSILREISNTYDPNGWSINGPKAIQRVLRKICLDNLEMTDHCEGLTIYPPKLFYPIWYPFHQIYVRNGNIDNTEPYMHHMWNYLTAKFKIEKESPYAKLAKRFCPTIYGMYGDDFGE